MRLVGLSDAMELRLVSYESPAAVDEWDADWLVVEIRAEYRGRQWRAQDAALLTGDVVELATWLERIAVGYEVPPELEFMEPCLWFSLAREPAEVRALCVNVAHELSPPWLTEGERLGEGVRLRFSPDAVALRAASASLRAQLASLR
jgi:hypothetical protein